MPASLFMYARIVDLGLFDGILLVIMTTQLVLLWYFGAVTLCALSMVLQCSHHMHGSCEHAYRLDMLHVDSPFDYAHCIFKNRQPVIFLPSRVGYLQVWALPSLTLKNTII